MNPESNEDIDMKLNRTKIRAEIRKLSIESDKLMLETRWYPMLLAVALFTAIATIVKVFF